MTKIYLAIPYSGMEHESMEISTQVAAYLMQQGHFVLSPITLSHPIAMKGNLPTHWEYWKELDKWLISCCEEVWITDLGQERISRSKGVQEEIQIAHNTGKTIRYICPMTYEISDKPINK